MKRVQEHCFWASALPHANSFHSAWLMRLHSAQISPRGFTDIFWSALAWRICVPLVPLIAQDILRRGRYGSHANLSLFPSRGVARLIPRLEEKESKREAISFPSPDNERMQRLGRAYCWSLISQTPMKNHMPCGHKLKQISVDSSLPPLMDDSISSTKSMKKGEKDRKEEMERKGGEQSGGWISIGKKRVCKKTKTFESGGCAVYGLRWCSDKNHLCPFNALCPLCRIWWEWYSSRTISHGCIRLPLHSRLKRLLTELLSYCLLLTFLHQSITTVRPQWPPPLMT